MDNNIVTQERTDHLRSKAIVLFRRRDKILPNFGLIKTGKQYWREKWNSKTSKQKFLKIRREKEE